MKRSFTRFAIFFVASIFVSIVSNAQVAINTTGSAAENSAMLDITSTSRGLLIPRMLESERIAISSPATGLMVYQTNNTSGFYYFTGSAWAQIGSGGSGSSQWTTNGNDIYYNIGNIGIGITSPNSSSLLDMTSTTKGLLIPRLTLVQRDAISSPATGLLIYQTDNTPGFYYYNGASWTSISVNSGVSAVTATSPLSSSGGASPNISLTGTVPIENGGTGATTPSDARNGIGAAQSGDNLDITSLGGLTTALTVSQGGTGAINATNARTNLGAAAKGDNSDITSLNGLTTPLSVSQGGTGATSLSTGQLLCGKGTSPITAVALYWNSNNKYFGINVPAPTHLLELSGGAYCNGTGAWMSGSDINYKKNIEKLSKYGLNSVLQMQPITYIHKSDPNNLTQIGFIAQEMKLIIPEVVEGEEGKMSLAYDRLVPVLVNAIKEQQEIIKTQDQRIKSLEERLNALEQKLSK